MTGRTLRLPTPRTRMQFIPGLASKSSLPTSVAVSVNVMLSMLSGSDREAFRDAVRDFVRSELDGHDHMMTFHDDTKHPHAHIAVLARDHDGRHLVVDRGKLASGATYALAAEELRRSAEPDDRAVAERLEMLVQRMPEPLTRAERYARTYQRAHDIERKAEVDAAATRERSENEPRGRDVSAGREPSKSGDGLAQPDRQRDCDMDR